MILVWSITSRPATSFPCNQLSKYITECSSTKPLVLTTHERHCSRSYYTEELAPNSFVDTEGERLGTFPFVSEGPPVLGQPVSTKKKFSHDLTNTYWSMLCIEFGSGFFSARLGEHTSFRLLYEQIASQVKHSRSVIGLERFISLIVPNELKHNRWADVPS
jgi:hypothetical protein